MNRTVGIDHLTLLQVSPPELVTIASETGFDAIGIRVATSGPGEEPWPITVGSPMLEETLRRLHETGVQVLDVEVIRLGHGTFSAPKESWITHQMTTQRQLDVISTS